MDIKEADVDLGSSGGTVGLRGSRGIFGAARPDRLMASNPAAFSAMMRDRVARHFWGADSSGSTGPRILEGYNQTFQGYHLCTISHVSRSLREGNAEGAELL